MLGMAGVWAWACAFSCARRRETERAHKYVYLHAHVTVCVCIHVTPRVLLCASLCLRSRTEQWNSNKKYQGEDNIWVLFGWQENIGLAVLCLLSRDFDGQQKKKIPLFLVLTSSQTKISRCFSRALLPKLDYPTNAGVTNKISSEFSILVSISNQGYLCSRVYLCRYQVLHGKLTQIN